MKGCIDTATACSLEISQHFTSCNASRCVFLGEESLLSTWPEETRKEEEEEVNESYQGTDHVLAETSECLYSQIGNVCHEEFR